MRNDLTNLLPIERRRALSRDYFVRLGVVVVLFVTMLTFVSIVLLVPTYVFLTKSARVKEVHLATIESRLSLTNESMLSARLTALSQNAATLSTLARAPSVSATIRSVLAISRPGIALSDFAYTPAEGTRRGALAVSGTAATRAALRSYQLILQSAPFASSADLPVSAYAKDSNITFTITVTLTP